MGVSRISRFQNGFRRHRLSQQQAYLQHPLHAPQRHTSPRHRLLLLPRSHLAPLGDAMPSDAKHPPQPPRRHHVSSTDKSGFNWGQDLTRAWAVAMHLRVDDRIIASLFEKVLVEKTVIDLEGLRDCFERDGGVDKVRFDRAWNDAGVVADAKYQDELSEGLPREKLPCIVVRGRRMVDGNELSHMDRDADFGPKVGELVRELLSLEE